MLYRVILKYATTHNHPQQSTTTQKTIHNHPQPPKKPPTTTLNHPQPPKSYPKKPKLVTYSYFTAL